MSNITLTPRQLQALQLLCAGRSQKQIADDLGISYRRVGHLFDQAYTRVGARGRVALVIWAVRKGLVRL